MLTEDLLKPRYKMIAPFPNMEDLGFTVGEILDRDWGFGGDDEIGYKSRISDYPHLFQPLSWYSERSIDDMPEYVKNDRYVFRHEYKIDKGVLYCNQWLGDESNPQNSTDWFVVDNSFEGLPATQQEYETCLTKNKTK